MDRLTKDVNHTSNISAFLETAGTVAAKIFIALISAKSFRKKNTQVTKYSCYFCKGFISHKLVNKVCVESNIFKK